MTVGVRPAHFLNIFVAHVSVYVARMTSLLDVLYHEKNAIPLPCVDVGL